MIRFKHKITVDQQRSGQWRIDTDRGDQYQLTQIQPQLGRHPITDWWSMNHQSQLRGWQMDIFIKELTRKGHGDDFVLWLAHKSGGGLSQPHDIAIMYHEGMKLWVLSTEEYHWLQEGSLIGTDFLVEHAFKANLLNPDDRQDIYALTDFLNQYYDQKETQ